MRLKQHGHSADTNIIVCKNIPDYTELKNASRNEKPSWLTTYENSVGSTDYNSIGNNTEDEDFKQASSNNNNTSMPNW